MYEDIREQIKIGKEEKQQILIIGDFNAKIGEAVEGNKTQVTKGGRQLLKLANKENMIILNTVKEKCKECREDKYKEVRSKRINRIAQEIRENVDNGGKIWEVKRRLEKKVQMPYSITNAEGIKLQNRLDIQEEYKKYKRLLKTREPDNESERIIEEEVNKKFQELIRKTNQIESITDEMVKKAIAKLKNKKASDRLGWRAEWLKEGGEEIVRSLKYSI